MLPLLFLLLSLSSFADTSQEPFHPSWLKIMRYTSGLFGHESEVKTDEYFFSKQGKNSPELEYKASLQQMELPFTGKDDHPICKFPGRIMLVGWVNDENPM